MKRRKEPIRSPWFAVSVFLAFLLGLVGFAIYSARVENDREAERLRKVADEFRKSADELRKNRLSR
jgi:uncharacterized membrane protein